MPTQVPCYNYTHNIKTEYSEELNTKTILKAKTKITNASDNDIILGRGGQFSIHPGNIRYRAILQQQVSEYNAAQNLIVKDAIAHSIYKKILPGRFLIRTCDGTYHEALNKKTARRKIKLALRDRIKWMRISEKRREAAMRSREIWRGALSR